MMIRIVFLAITVFFSWCDSDARTIRVEVDGSGDFQNLQEASEAAASGDTILIGPGEYGKYGMTVPSSCFGEDRDMVMNVQVERLTIIGAGPEETILGPVEEYNSPYNPSMVGIALMGECGVKYAAIKNIGFRNCTNGIFSYPGSGDFSVIHDTGLQVENCSFEGNFAGIVYNGFRTEMRNCTGSSDVDYSYFVAEITGGYPSVLIVEDCDFSFSSVGGSHVAAASDSLAVSNCHFSMDYPFLSGVGVNSSAVNAHIENSTFCGMSMAVWAIGVNTDIETSLFENVRIGVQIERDAQTFCIQHSRFFDISEASIFYREGVQSGRVFSCRLEKGSSGVVRTRNGIQFSGEQDFSQYHFYFLNEPLKDGKDANSETRHFDMRYNSWGTDEPDSIQAWIQDANDIPGWPIVVDWFPFKTGQVGTERRSFGNLKANFR